jgi:hypothetical protein
MNATFRNIIADHRIPKTVAGATQVLSFSPRSTVMEIINITGHHKAKNGGKTN